PWSVSEADTSADASGAIACRGGFGLNELLAAAMRLPRAPPAAPNSAPATPKRSIEAIMGKPSGKGENRASQRYLSDSPTRPAIIAAINGRLPADAPASKPGTKYKSGPSTGPSKKNQIKG